MWQIARIIAFDGVSEMIIENVNVLVKLMPKNIFTERFEENRKYREMKKIPTSRLLDKLHRGVVIACIGLTFYGTALIGNRVYRYFTVIKPQRETADLKMLEVRKNLQSNSGLW